MSERKRILPPSNAGRVRPAPARRGLARRSWIAIAAVAVVLGAISATRMQVFAVHANERDAVQLLRQLGRNLSGVEPGHDSLRALAEGVLRPAEGATWSAEGSRLRRHGYLFTLVEGADGPRLCAWPSEHPHTGRAAFQWTPRQGLLGHRNREGRWSGDAQPPDLLEGAAWVPLED